MEDARMYRLSTRTAWLPAAAGLLGAAWGSNQFTPMLLVYHRALGLGTGTLEALFGVYALGLVPGLLIAGPLSDRRGRRDHRRRARPRAPLRRAPADGDQHRRGVRSRDGVAARALLARRRGRR